MKPVCLNLHSTGFFSFSDCRIPVAPAILWDPAHRRGGAQHRGSQYSHVKRGVCSGCVRPSLPQQRAVSVGVPGLAHTWRTQETKCMNSISANWFFLYTEVIGSNYLMYNTICTAFHIQINLCFFVQFHFLQVVGQLFFYDIVTPICNSLSSY